MFPDVTEITEIESHAVEELPMGNTVMDVSAIYENREVVMISAVSEEESTETESVHVYPAEATSLSSGQASASIGPEAETKGGLDEANRNEEAVAVMVCNDPGCLWGNVNDWIGRDDFEGYYLHIRLLEHPDVQVRFIPFGQHGGSLKGLKPHPASRRAWSRLAASASSSNQLYYAVSYHFERIG